MTRSRPRRSPKMRCSRGSGLPACCGSSSTTRHRPAGRVVIVDSSRTRRSSTRSALAPTGTTRASPREPEIVAALNGLTCRPASGRSGDAAHGLYVAIPVASAGSIFGAVRITYPTSALDHRIKRYRVALVAVALIVLAVAALVGLLLARSIARPLRTARIRRGARRRRRALGAVPPRTTGRPTCDASPASSIARPRSSPRCCGRRSSSSPMHRTSCGRL